MHLPCKVCAVFALVAGVALVGLSWLWSPAHFIEDGWGGALALLIGIAYFAPRLWGAIAFLGATQVAATSARWNRVSADLIAVSLVAIGIVKLFPW
jgi:hypothetical protein